MGLLWIDLELVDNLSFPGVRGGNLSDSILFRRCSYCSGQHDFGICDLHSDVGISLRIFDMHRDAGITLRMTFAQFALDDQVQNLVVTVKFMRRRPSRLLCLRLIWSLLLLANGLNGPRSEYRQEC